MSTLIPLTFSLLKTKKQLIDLYISQYPEKWIRNEINEILKTTRKSTPEKMICFVKNISNLEVIIFIANSGTPQGYILGNEISTKLNEYKVLQRNY